MELSKQPETEVEYWRTIESIGGFIYSTRRGINRGHIDDAEGLANQDIIDAQIIQEKLLAEIIEKFGVIHPNDCSKLNPAYYNNCPPAPDGKIYYWDWYHKLAREVSLIEYQKLLCSACPFSAGFDGFISNWQVTCKFNDSYPTEYRSHHIYLCFKANHSTDFGGSPITLQDIYIRILTEYGQETLDIFKAKEVEVRSLV